MRPTRLMLHNFMSYKDASIDLADISLAAIVGPNGAGKSTLLQAVTYALWGQVKTSSHDDIVRRGSGDCAVSIEFAIGEEDYRVTRRRSLGGRGSSDLELVDLNLNQPLTGPTIRDTQAMIDKIIGMGYDVFSNSALLQQGEASKFSDARPAQRKELLAEMLGLWWLQELERRARKYLNALVSEHGSAMSIFTRDQLALEELGKPIDLRDLGARKQKAAASIKEAEEQIEYLRSHKDKVVGLERELNFAKKEQSSIESMMSRTQAAMDDLIDEIRTLQAWEVRKDDLLGQKEKIEALKKEDEAFGADSTTHAFLLASSAGHVELAREHSEVFDMLKTLEGALEGLTETIAKELTDGNDLSEQYNGLTKNAQDLRVELSRLEESYKEARKKKELFETETVCPTCGQHIDDPDGHILAELEQDMDGLEAMIWDARNNVSTTQAESCEAYDKLTVVQLQIDEDRKTESQLKQDIASLKQRLDNLAKEIDKKREAQKGLGDLKYDAEAHKRIKDQLNAFSNTEQEIAKMEAALERLEKARAKLIAESDQFNADSAALSEVNEKITELQSELDRHEDVEWLEDEIRKWWTEAESFKQELEEINEQITSATVHNQRIADLTKSVEEGEEKVKSLNEKIAIAEGLVAGSSKTGAQALIIEAVLPQIEKDANEYLSAMSNNIQLMLESQKTTKSGNVSESLDITVFADGMTAPIESLSGGERFRADLALRLAIGKMLARRFGASVKMLAIDEGFGALDGDGQDSVLEVISSLAGFFDLILVISHVQSVAESIGMVGSTIFVSKSGETSKVEVK